MIDNIVEHISYVGVVIALILTGAGLPIPEEVIVIAAGVTSANGALNPGLAFACCIIGALLGDCVMYFIGFHFGRRLLHGRSWYTRLLHTEREKKIERMIQVHGLKVFFLARFLVGLRSPVYLTAGILHVPFRKFILVDAFCASIVISIFFWLSYLFASQIGGWFRYIRGAEVALSVGIVIAVVVAALIWGLRQRRLRNTLGVADDASTVDNATNDRSKVL